MLENSAGDRPKRFPSSFPDGVAKFFSSSSKKSAVLLVGRNDSIDWIYNIHILKCFTVSSNVISFSSSIFVFSVFFRWSSSVRSSGEVHLILFRRTSHHYTVFGAKKMVQERRPYYTILPFSKLFSSFGAQSRSKIFSVFLNVISTVLVHSA